MWFFTKVPSDNLSIAAGPGWLGQLVQEYLSMPKQPAFLDLRDAMRIWSKAMRSGRSRFVRTLGVNDQDVFAAAGLMENPTPQHVVTWWDTVSGHARLISDQEKME